MGTLKLAEGSLVQQAVRQVERFSDLVSDPRSGALKLLAPPADVGRVVKRHLLHEPVVQGESVAEVSRARQGPTFQSGVVDIEDLAFVMVPSARATPAESA